MAEVTSESGLSAGDAAAARRRLAIIASLLLVVTAGGAALFLVQGFDRQISDVLRTYEVRTAARELSLALTEAETGQRGYALTQDDRYLDPYRDAMSVVEQQMAALRALTEDNPRQNQRVHDLQDDVSRKVVEMSRTVTLVASGEQEEAEALIRSDTGLYLMRDLRQAISTFTSEEEGLLAERNAQFEQTRRLLIISVLAALVGSTVLAYALFSRTQKQMSALSRSQNALMVQRDELEAHVRARTAELEEARAHAEHERLRVETLLQDTNHRIGNSLATVSSLLALQVNRARSEEVRAALDAARSRVHTIASGHRRLRLGDDLETTLASDFLESVVDDLRDTQSGGASIAFACAFEPILINARDATTIGIVLGELATNALKHAFPDGRRGQIEVGLYQDAEGVVTLSVADDGVGMPEGGDNHESGLGSMIVGQLARQFGGEPHVSPREGGGTRVSIPLPKLVVATAKAG